MKSKALVIVRQGLLELKTIHVPDPGGNQVLVEVAHSCISPGTEARVLAGVQENMPNLPVIPGYSAAGIVKATGAGSVWRVGQHVFFSGAPCADFPVCWGAHQGHVVVGDAALVEVPVGVDLRAASCAKLVAIAEHGRRLANIGKGDRVAIVGLGPIGFFAALCARAHGAEVSVSDLCGPRLEMARRLGLDIVDYDLKESPYTVVVDATGAPSAMAGAIRLLQEKPWNNELLPATRFVIQGSYASPPLLPYSELFWREPNIFVPRDNQRRDVESALEMMSAGLLPVENVVEDLGSPADAPCAYQTLTDGHHVTGAFTWNCDSKS